MVAVLVREPPSLETAMDTVEAELRSPYVLQLSAVWQLNLFGGPDDAIVYYTTDRKGKHRERASHKTTANANPSEG